MSNPLVKFWRFLLAKPTDHTDEQNAAALSILSDNGIGRGIYSSIGNPEAELKEAEARIARFREWADTLSNASERSAYYYWLDHFEDQCAEARKTRIYREHVKSIERNMAQPSHDIFDEKGVRK